MREYGAVSPQFWIGKTGKALRGDLEAQLLALYLMTSPHANMIGVFHCPVLYMAHETGLGVDRATAALDRLVGIEFCEYDQETETVFVIRMAAHQVGENLKSDDNKVKGVQKEWARISTKLLRDAFFKVYGKAYHLASEAPSKPLRSPDEAPSKQLTGTGTETGTQPPLPPEGEPDGFTTFWAEWPASTRKGGRVKCLEAWRKAKCEGQSLAILAHVRQLKTSDDWNRDGGRYIPAPLVYLNQRRWDGASAEGGSSGGLQLAGAL
jgi:hypothetical protein